ncbi:MAG: Ig-like domain-containing protein, partial [Muribaculaceae bacterium]|nr:Ig-like domain-containing protein [Muribaculaceae bacterium]
PQVSANGKRVTVDFRDTLLPNTTYTIDFADAIKDLNEGNILDGFALDFSTGDSIDSLRISGMVLQAENLEPAQGMLVGVYSTMTDTTLTSVPFERIARTNQYGHFTIRNLKPGSYHIFAINDLNRDYHWDRSEDIAFYDTVIVPYTEPVTVTDTLFAANGEDSLVTRPGIRFMPNDILLSWFNVNYKAHYLSDHKRVDRRRFTLTFGAPNDTMPEVTIVDGAPGAGRRAEEWARIKANATADSLEYWIADPEVLAADSLRLAVRYLKTDTLERNVWTTDTLRFFFRDTEKKKKDKKKDDNTPKFTVDSITGDTTFLPPPDLEYLGIKAIGGSSQEFNKPLLIETTLPTSSVDSAGIRLEMAVDTLWKPVKFEMRPDSSNLLLRNRLDVKWDAGAKYRLSIDTLAMTSLYGQWNRPFEHEFTVKNIEDYATLKLRLPGTDSLDIIVELLNSNDSPVYSTTKPSGKTEADIRFIAPGTYYARAIIDRNGNGKWDTGNPVDSL